jgi:long-chain acyl-CoA synthetase
MSDGRMSVAEADKQLTAAGEMFETEEVDIRGVRTTVWKNCPPTLGTILARSRAHGDAVFLVYEDERTTFEEHFRAAAHLAHILRERFGVESGDRVAIAMRNFPEWSVAFWAATAAGAVAVPLNAWWTGEELHYGLADSGSKVLICDQQRADRITPYCTYLPDLRSTVVARASGRDVPLGMLSFEDVLGTVPAQVDLPDIAIDPDDDATIFYTSGTTGRPKGALGTHRNICTNPISLLYVNARNALRSGPPAGPNPAPRNSYLLSVPLFHATGCHSILATNIIAGGKLVMMHRWEAARALELIERERITTFGGVPTMVMQVIDHPDFDKRDTSSVRSVGYGGAPAPPDLVRRIKAHFPGGSASNGYGLTETSSLSTMNVGADYEAKPDSVGPPVPVVSIRVVDPDGKEVPLGATGELWIQGPNVVKGYWGKPEATAATFSDGWLHTGDIARLDDEGFVYIVDRAKDMLIRGGENVYCVEIEGVLHEHAAVADAAVIGIPHSVLGEEVGAVVYLRPGKSASAAEIQEHVAARLAGFKVPVQVWFADRPLPRNPAGKILKRQLRDELVGPA